MEYGANLSARMKELCISQERLAEVIGMSQKTVSRYLNGAVRTSTREQWEILKYCHREYRNMLAPLPFPTFGEWLEGVRKGYDVSD